MSNIKLPVEHYDIQIADYFLFFDQQYNIIYRILIFR